MPAGRSQIPEVRRALRDRLVARAGLASLVTLGIPRNAPRDEWIAVGDVEGRQESASLGRLRREERFTVQVVVSVVRSGIELPEDVTDRAFDLVAEIEDELRDDPTAGVPIPAAGRGVYWCNVAKTDLSERFDGDQRSSHVTVHVECMTRI